jgi:D-amino-acid oxidase
VNQPITVVGAGVVGLSSAIRLAEAGHPVEVLARDFPLETVSATAGGLWMPFLAEPAEAVARWSRLTYDALFDLVGADVGIVPRQGYILDGEPEPPSWTEGLPRLEVTSVDNPTPKHEQGWRMRVPIVDMTVYLPYLVRRLEAAGGKLIRRTLTELPVSGVVVNCSGLDARELAADPSVHPIRGQVVRVSNPGISTWLSDDMDLERVTYVIPHPQHIIVGGTAGVNDWSMTADKAVAAQILERACELLPDLRAASILSHKVGLRPARPAVRLETVRGQEGAVVHCYGHGGSGVTMSWGCADDVLIAVQEALAAA